MVVFALGRERDRGFVGLLYALPVSSMLEIRDIDSILLNLSPSQRSVLTIHVLDLNLWAELQEFNLLALAGVLSVHVHVHGPRPIMSPLLKHPRHPPSSKHCILLPTPRTEKSSPISESLMHSL